MTCRRCHENVERRMKAEAEFKEARILLERYRLKMEEASEMLLAQLDDNQTLRERLSGIAAIPTDLRH